MNVICPTVTLIEARTYRMEVHVTDKELPGVIIIPISIQIVPSNDFPPICTDSSLTVSENGVAVGAVLFHVQASDQDDTPHGIIEYSLAGKHFHLLQCQ